MENNPYMRKEPMSLEDMQFEIAMSKIKGPYVDFSKEAVSALLKYLNLRNNNAGQTGNTSTKSGN